MKKGTLFQKPGESPCALPWGAVLFVYADVNLHSAAPLAHMDLQDCNFSSFSHSDLPGAGIL